VLTGQLHGVRDVQYQEIFYDKYWHSKYRDADIAQ